MLSLFLVVSFAICLAVTVLFASRQLRENRAVGRFVSEYLHGTPQTWETALQLVQKLREEFNTDQDSFLHLNMRNRSFLREPTEKLLGWKEGLCGEGARVLICCLAELGYDATRVTLFTRWLHPSHTVVSVLIDGEEYFIDTLNSQQDFFEFLSTRRVAASDFRIMGHVSDVNARREIKRSLRDTPPDMAFEQAVGEKYLFYSYDALPYTKVTAVLGLDLRIVNLKRPPARISVLAERPYSILTVIMGGLSITLGAVVIWLLSHQ